MFRVAERAGFELKFSTGYSISVMFDRRNYCENRYSKTPACCHTEPMYLEPDEDGFRESKDAEVAVFLPDGDYVKLLPCDAVVGWKDTDTVGHLIGYLATGGTDLEQMRDILGVR